MTSLEKIRSAFSAHVPDTEPAAVHSDAAVAMILREIGGKPELLFIERAHREGDPWSGHMAFPGGRLDPGDDRAQSAAERETLEEVGVDLAAAEILGRLDDLRGRHAAAPNRGMVISAFVYHLADPGPLQLNWEVQDAFWIPVAALLDPQRHVGHAVAHHGETTYPGILVGEPERHVVWGLTYRFLEVFFEVVGQPLPDRWDVLQGRPARPFP
jgi:8-oxo-dGTP pyrophosphatase MutT (NUDIX family)